MSFFNKSKYGPAGNYPPPKIPARNNRQGFAYNSEKKYDNLPSKTCIEDTEMVERRKRLETLMKMSISERLEEFRKLSLDEQRTLFLPQDVYLGALPPKTYPGEWDSKQDKASIATIAAVKAEQEEGEVMSEDESIHSHYSGYSTDGLYGSNNRVRTTLHGELVYLADKLRFCPPLTLGFHAMEINNRDNDRWCYCPCGNNMGPWRNFAGVNYFLEDHSPSRLCTFKGKKRPNELFKHIETLKNNNCPAHAIIWEYLTRLFADYHGPGIRHIALEDQNTTAFRKAQQAIDKKVAIALQKLQKEADMKFALEQKLAEAKEAEKRLQESNEELANQLKAAKEMKDSLQAKEEIFEDVTLTQLKDHYRSFCGVMRKAYVSPKTNKLDEVEFKIDRNFDLSGFMHDKYTYWVGKNKDITCPFAFLFSEIKHRSNPHIGDVMKRWNVKFEHNCLRLSKRQRNEVMQGIVALDQGGPSKEFFNKIFNQLDYLTVTIGWEGKFKLFTKEFGGFQPQRDEFLLHYINKSENFEETLEMVKGYYRAIGRFFAHCLLLSEDDYGPIPIYSHSFPVFYQTVLLRGLNPKSEEYCLGSLVDHISSLLCDGDSAKDNSTKSKSLFLQLGLGKEAKEEVVRAKIDEIFIQSRGIALSALADGISLSGFVDWSHCFRWTPSQALGRIAFAHQEITEAHLFDKDGQFRFIVFGQEDPKDYTNKIRNEEQITVLKDCEQLKETQQKFEAAMYELFRRKSTMQAERTFLNEFVYYCTATPYIPDLDLNPDYKIYVEYDYSELTDNALPKVHTCTNTIRIPARAYDANIETFCQKLETAMSYCHGGFDME